MSLSEDEKRRFRRELKQDDGHGDDGIFATIFTLLIFMVGFGLALGGGYVLRALGCALLLGGGIFSLWIEGLFDLPRLMRTPQKPLKRRFIRGTYERYSLISDALKRFRLGAFLLLIAAFGTWKLLDDLF